MFLQDIQDKDRSVKDLREEWKNIKRKYIPKKKDKLMKKKETNHKHKFKRKTKQKDLERKKLRKEY